MKTNSKMPRILAVAMPPMLFWGTILCSSEAIASVSDDDTTLPQIIVSKPTPVQVVENPEIAPQFKEGEVAIYQRLAQEMKYPKDAVDAKQEGKVVVEFIVNTNGTATDFKIAKSAGVESLDNEALRVCKDQLSSDWIPGKDKGQPVACSFTLPVIFRLK